MLAAVGWAAAIDAIAAVATCCGDMALKPFRWLHVGVSTSSLLVPGVVLSLFLSCFCSATDGRVTGDSEYANAMRLPSVLGPLHDATITQILAFFSIVFTAGSLSSL